MSDCLAIANVALRDPLDKSYLQSDKYEAIRFVLSEFGRLSRYPRVTVSVPLVTSTYAYDVTSVASDFLPNRVIEARIGSTAVSIDAFESLRNDREDGPDSVGKPESIGWETASTAWVFPTPDASYTLTLIYSQPVGLLPNPGSTVPFPVEWVRGCMWFGVPAVLRLAEQSDLTGDPMWMKFVRFVNECAGVDDNVGDLLGDQDQYI